MDKLITIKAWLTPGEAHMMQAVLASEDIYSFLKDENSVVIAPYLANAIGGIKLQVRAADLSKAVDLLREAGYLNEESPGPPGSAKLIPVIILVVILCLLTVYMYLKMNSML